MVALAGIEADVVLRWRKLDFLSSLKLFLLYCSTLAKFSASEAFAHSWMTSVSVTPSALYRPTPVKWVLAEGRTKVTRLKMRDNKLTV